MLSDRARPFVKPSDTVDDLLQAGYGTAGQGFIAGIWKCYYRRNNK